MPHPTKQRGGNNSADDRPPQTQNGQDHTSPEPRPTVSAENLDPVVRSRIFREARAAEREEYNDRVDQLRADHRRERQRLQDRIDELLQQVDRENREKREALDQVARLKSQQSGNELEEYRRFQQEKEQLKDRIHELKTELKIKEIETEYAGGDRSLADALLELAQKTDLGEVAGKVLAVAQQMKQGSAQSPQPNPSVPAAGPSSGQEGAGEPPSGTASLSEPSQPPMDGQASSETLRQQWRQQILNLVLSGLSSGRVQQAAQQIESQVQALRAQGLEPKRGDWGVILKRTAKEVLQTQAGPEDLAQVLRPVLGRYQDTVEGFLNTDPETARDFLTGFLELTNMSEETQDLLTRTIESLQVQARAEQNGTPVSSPTSSESSE